MFSIDDLDLDFEEDSGTKISCNAELVPEKLTELSICNFRLPLIQKEVNFADRNLPESPPLRIKVFRPTVLRKFPGPAGLLPDKPPRTFDDSSAILGLEGDTVEDKRNDPNLYTQASEVLFCEPPFQKLQQDFELYKSDNILNTYTVQWVKKKTISKNLKGRKIPFLAVVLQGVDCSSTDPILSLRDPTGELSAALHRDVWHDMGSKLKVGAAIALKQVSVLSTGVLRRQVLLNITMNNILTVYSPAEDGDVIVNSVQPTTTANLAQSIADWQARSESMFSESPCFSKMVASPEREFFQTVSSVRRVDFSASTPMRRISNELLPDAHLRKDKNDTVSVPPRNDDDVGTNFVLDFNDDDFSEEISATIPPANRNSRLSIIRPCSKEISGTQTSQIPSKNEEKTRKRLSPTRNNKSISELNEDSAKKFRYECSSQLPLTQAESVIIDEVFSGVDLEDFE